MDQCLAWIRNPVQWPENRIFWERTPNRICPTWVSLADTANNTKEKHPRCMDCTNEIPKLT